jgi:hypothetical protein
MGWTLDSDAQENGRVHQAKITVLEDDGSVLFTDRADLTAIRERSKLAKRVADRLGVDPKGPRKNWNAAGPRRSTNGGGGRVQRPRPRRLGPTKPRSKSWMASPTRSGDRSAW